MLAVGFALVWWSGGTKTAVPHVLYFPVVIAALVAGWRAGAVTGVVGGLVLGPLMPLNVEVGMSQPASGWLIRMGFFVAVGVLVGEGRRRLLELAESRQRFVSAISHEVRTPLAAILGFSQMLAERGDDFTEGERREFAELIYREVADLSDIVDGYILAARMDDSALIVDPQDTNLLAAVRSAVERLPRPVRETRIHITGEPVVCWADPMRTRQVIRAVLAHVLAYGGDHIRVSVRADAQEGVVVVETDNQGTPHRDMAQAMSPLSGGDPGESRPHPVGLGLAVASRLAELMGGRLNHHERSRVDVFEVRLPTSPVVDLRSTRTLTPRWSN